MPGTLGVYIPAMYIFVLASSEFVDLPLLCI